jgi:hypothetical protein
MYETGKIIGNKSPE